MTSTQVKQGWENVKLADIAEITSSKRIFYSEYVESGVPFYRSREIIETFNNKEISLDLFISENKYEEIKQKFGVPQEGDLLITSVGTLGVPYRVKKDDKFYFKDGNLIWLRKLNNSLIESKYLFYWLTDEQTQARLKNVSIGSSQKAFTISAIKDVSIQLPPLKIQQKVASILSAFDDLIENNTKRIKILENTAQLIYKEWFVDFKFPGHEKVKMVDSGTEFGEIPEGWEVKEIKDFGEVITGKTPSKKVPENFGNDVPFIKTPDMHGEMFIIETNESLSLEGAETQKKKTLPENSLIVSCIGSVGVVAITSKDSQTNQQINAVVLNDEILREYLYIVFLGLKPTLEGLGSSGATMCNVNKQKFEAIKILAPTNQVLEEYHRIVAPLFDETLALQRQKKQLQEVRDLILPKLVNGEIYVG